MSRRAGKGRHGRLGADPGVLEVISLQMALARLVAYRAIDRVVDQQILSTIARLPLDFR